MCVYVCVCVCIYICIVCDVGCICCLLGYCPRISLWLLLLPSFFVCFVFFNVYCPSPNEFFSSVQRAKLLYILVGSGSQSALPPSSDNLHKNCRISLPSFVGIVVWIFCILASLKTSFFYLSVVCFIEFVVWMSKVCLAVELDYYPITITLLS